MRHRQRLITPAVLTALCTLTAQFATAATLTVVVPAKEPSRPAHFVWRFTSASGDEPRSGTFACGSHWVAPAEGDDGVTLVSLGGNPAWNDDLLSCDADPVTERHGLLSGEKRYGSHVAEENILPRLPMTFRPEPRSCVSLVAAMQRNEAATSKGGTAAIVGEVVDAYCVVTVLPQPPPNGGANSIRPNMTGATKELLTWDDFDLERLPKHAFLPGKTAAEWESARRRWRHNSEVFGLATEVPGRKGGRQFQKFSEGGRAFRAALVVHDYASGVARAFNDDLLALFAADSRPEAYKGALAAMLAYGLDTYHARYDYGTTGRKRWSCGAGQSPGEFMPAVLLAALSRDPAKGNVLRRAAATCHGSDPGEWGPQELRQIHRGTTGVLLWGDGHPILRRDRTTLLDQDWRYWADMTGSKCYDGYEGEGNPNRGKKTAADPYGFIDGPANKPGSAYMGVALGPFRSFAAAMILMPEIRSIVNTDAPIEYVDRVTRHGLWTWPDPVAAPAKVDRETARPWWRPEGCTEWGQTWGPRLDDVRFAVEDGRGRFRSLHGRPLKGGYETAAASAHWDAIVALYDGERFEANVVGLDTVVAPDAVVVPGNPSEVYLSCATPDARIHYTVDGTAPTEASPVYEGAPVRVDGPAQVRAVAFAAGKKPSRIREATVR